ncbi:hypothetical protein M8C13_07275 [Crossiella sp. SN42]|uniref:hypothetical protein n=1 Tax=Crossiella sp. SN42 TaxID=2944808 RepID=UPI00207C1D1C|nr:hypothetical protein [Crossiella sp. SN42]MCO1575558.1 hypothetical protein [Crossiella sp. SN42]
MILVETLEGLVYNYIKDPARPGSAVGKINTQHLVSNIVQHLAERGVDVGFQDGSRLTVSNSTSRRPEPERHRLPLILQKNDDGHVGIHCDDRDCVRSWSLYQHASAQTKGDTITDAVAHAIRRHCQS